MAKCFLIGPIGEPEDETRIKADWVRDGIIKPVLENPPFDYNVTRADEISEPGLITVQVINAIVEADLIIADLTDFNPNAYYELGIAHVEQKPVIHIIDGRQTPPFDLHDYRAVFYSTVRHSDVEKAKSELTLQVEATEKPDYVVANPVTKALGHRELATSGDTKDKLIADLLDKFSNTDSRLHRLDAKIDAIIAMPSSGLATVGLGIATPSSGLATVGLGSLILPTGQVRPPTAFEELLHTGIVAKADEPEGSKKNLGEILGKAIKEKKGTDDKGS